MIVPSGKLLTWSAIIVLPAAAMAGTLPAFSRNSRWRRWDYSSPSPCWTPCLGWARLKESRCNFPPSFDCTKTGKAPLRFKFKNDRQKEQRIRLGLALPREFSTKQEEMAVLLPGQSSLSRLARNCTGLRRGRYQLDKCYLEGQSPLGFWAVRAGAPAQSELRVYPNLLTERKTVASLFSQHAACSARMFNGNWVKDAISSSCAITLPVTATKTSIGKPRQSAGVP